MENARFKEMQDLYLSTIFDFYRMALGTQGKTWDDILPTADGKNFFKEMRAARGNFAKKLNQLLKKRASETGKDHQEARAQRTLANLQG